MRATEAAPSRRWSPLGSATRRLRAFLASLRLRLVWWVVVLLALATIGSVLVVRQVLFQGLDVRIDAELRQEADEVRRLAQGNDPTTGEPFGPRVDRIFEVFLDRNIPSRHELVLTFVDGEPFRQSAGAFGNPLAPEDPAMRRWATLAGPERGSLDTSSGALEYLAVPFRSQGETEGVFVVAILRDLQRAEADAAAAAAATVGVIMLLLGSILAVRLAAGILKPVRLVTRTAQSISETDLTQRIPVSGHDEISELASTFNAMLERLQAAFAAQRRFIDDAGHELRTPITIIRGHLELMGDDPADRERTLTLVHDELDRVSRMVDDLIILARAEQPDFLRARTIDLGEVTRAILDKARGLGDRRWQLDATASGTVVADEQRLTEAALQLSENAVRHTQAGDIIAIGSARNASTWRLWVRDTGPGIAAAERERIFERFYRGRVGRRRAEGSGLGLSIVQAIADAHGGRVDLETRPGEGSTFSIVVPHADGGGRR